MLAMSGHLTEWVLDDMETVSARDVTMWAELPSSSGGSRRP